MSGRKVKWDWLAAFAPALLAALIVTILDALGILKLSFTVHDIGKLILFTGLTLTVVVASALMARESIKQMRATSRRQARDEFATEHNRFLQRLDHELKNPLTSIKLTTSNLAEADQPEERQRLKGQIDAQLNRLDRLVVDLRKVATLSGQELEQTSVDLDDLLAELFAAAQKTPQAERRIMQLNLPRPPDRLPAVVGDADLLYVAVYNLVNNAIKYSGPGDSVTLTASADDEWIEIQVQDTGPGIAQADLPLIWDELFRSSRARAVPGTGIGLTLVRLIIERHGGTVGAHSQEGQGATFVIHLPVYPAITKM